MHFIRTSCTHRRTRHNTRRSPRRTYYTQRSSALRIRPNRTGHTHRLPIERISPCNASRTHRATIDGSKRARPTRHTRSEPLRPGCITRRTQHTATAARRRTARTHRVAARRTQRACRRAGWGVRARRTYTGAGGGSYGRRVRSSGTGKTRKRKATSKVSTRGTRGHGRRRGGMSRRLAGRTTARYRYRLHRWTARGLI